jgi:hypothetical protein
MVYETLKRIIEIIIRPYINIPILEVCLDILQVLYKRHYSVLSLT